MPDVEFKDYSLEVKSKLEKIAMAWLHEAGGELVSQIKRSTAVGKYGGGQTKSSWDYKVDSSKQTVAIGSSLENAIWEEFGTGEYALKGDGRKGGWYIHVGYGENDITPETVAAYGMRVYYGKDGQQFVHTHGKKPKRTLFHTFNSMKKKIRSALEDRLKGV